jgi:hypothetical protein
MQDLLLTLCHVLFKQVYHEFIALYLNTMSCIESMVIKKLYIFLPMALDGSMEVGGLHSNFGCGGEENSCL